MKKRPLSIFIKKVVVMKFTTTFLTKILRGLFNLKLTENSYFILNYDGSEMLNFENRENKMHIYQIRRFSFAPQLTINQYDTDKQILSSPLPFDLCRSTFAVRPIFDSFPYWHKYQNALG